MESIVVKKINRTDYRIDIEFLVSKGIERYFICKNFFVEYDTDISNVPDSIAVIPLLANLLPFSWITDCIIWVDEIDYTFYEMIPKLKQAFQEMYRNYPFGGTLIAARKVEHGNENTAQKALQLFTGGVDATTTFYRIEDKQPSLLNIYGWFIDDIKENEVYNADKKAIQKFASINQTDSYFARSNFGRFIKGSELDAKYYKKIKGDWWFGFQHSMAFLGIATVLGTALHANKIYIASSYTFGQEVRCASDPRTDGCFACGAMTTVHDGYELSRQDKISFLVKKQKQIGRKIPLRVCSFNDKNCCQCEKCYRTMLAIVAEGGKITDFGFETKGTLLEGINEFLKTKILALNLDHIVFWRDIISLMGKNIDELEDKELYQFLKDYPFEKEYKKARMKYYKTHFWNLVRIKLSAYLKKV